MLKNRYSPYNDCAVHDKLTGRVYVAPKLVPILNKLDRHVKELTGERDRLREALRLMVDDYENYPGDISLAIMTRAKAALQEDGDE